jgi:transposase
MPLPRAVLVALTAAERKTLTKRARGAKTAHRDRLRAQVVLAAARGRDNARIAADLRVTVDTVRKWRGRFAARGLDGLADLPRCGRPRRISELTRAAVVALACQLPAATGVPLSRWTGPELLAELTRAGAAEQLSASSVLRILAEHPVKPWQYQSWIWPRDPHFEARAAVILDLYQGYYEARGCSRATGSCRSMPSLPFRPAAAAGPPPRPRAASRYGSSTNTSATAPWPCWPPSTCVPGKCSLPPRPPPASPRSWT